MKKEGIHLYKVKQSSIDKLKKLIEIDEVKKSIEIFSKYGKNSN
jgi:hypothetical protein